jgi:hypothetical protein
MRHEFNPTKGRVFEGASLQERSIPYTTCGTSLILQKAGSLKGLLFKKEVFPMLYLRHELILPVVFHILLGHELILKKVGSGLKECGSRCPPTSLRCTPLTFPDREYSRQQ